MTKTRLFSRKKLLQLVLVLGAFVLLLSLNGEYSKPWFVVFLGILSIIGVFAQNEQAARWDIRLDGSRLAPLIQLALSILIIIATIIATDWRTWSDRDYFQWMWGIIIIFTFFPGGFKRIWLTITNLSKGK